MKHFIQADKDIFYCEGVITKDGEKVKLSLTDKMIYFHMYDRKKLFSDKGSKHFESQSTIATLLFIDTKTAAKSLTKLLQSGLVFGHKESHPLRGYSHWVYTDVNTSLLCMEIRGRMLLHLLAMLIQIVIWMTFNYHSKDVKNTKTRKPPIKEAVFICALYISHAAFVLGT